MRGQTAWPRLPCGKERIRKGLSAESSNPSLKAFSTYDKMLLYWVVRAGALMFPIAGEVM